MWIGHWFIAEPPPQLRVDHVGHHRTGPDEPVCVRTRVYLLLWRGHSESLEYCECYRAAASGYEASGVLPNAGALQAKLLLVHGMADDNVLFTNSTMMMQALQANAMPFDVMTYPGSKHGLVRMPVQGRHFYEMVLRFFDREL